MKELLRIIQEVKSIQELLDKYIEIRNNELLNKIEKKDELINVKGYSERDVTLLKEWGLTEQSSDYFPNLYDERRIGVTNLMYVSGGNNGGTNEVIIFLKPKSNQSQTSINFSCNWGNWETGYRNIIHDFLREHNRQADVFVLMRLVERGKGNSAGIGHYLALYSVFHKIPLPRNLGSTGTVEGEKVGAIGGLRWKLKGAVNKKNVRKQPDEVDTFILSEENKKDEEYPDDSYEYVPSDITNKVKQVHFTKQKKDLEKHLNEVLIEPRVKKECLDSKEDKPTPKPEEPKPRAPPINSEITAEQLLTLITELSISQSKGENQDFWEKLKVSYSKNPNYQTAVNKSLRLHKEYLRKLEKLSNSQMATCSVCGKQFSEGFSGHADDDKTKFFCSDKCLEKGREDIKEILRCISGGGQGNGQKKKRLLQEYQDKFQKIASSISSLTQEVLLNLESSYVIRESKWTSELQAPSLTIEIKVGVSFRLDKK